MVGTAHPTPDSNQLIARIRMRTINRSSTQTRWPERRCLSSESPSWRSLSAQNQKRPVVRSIDRSPTAHLQSCPVANLIVKRRRIRMTRHSTQTMFGHRWTAEQQSSSAGCEYNRTHYCRASRTKRASRRADRVRAGTRHRNWRRNDCCVRRRRRGAARVHDRCNIRRSRGRNRCSRTTRRG